MHKLLEIVLNMKGICLFALFLSLCCTLLTHLICNKMDFCDIQFFIIFLSFYFIFFYSILVFIQYLYNCIRNRKQEIEELWGIIDLTSKKEKEFILKMIKNHNKASIEIVKDMKDLELFNIVVYQTLEQYQGYSMYDFFDDTKYKKEYKLTDDYYRILKYSYKKYGRISHFDTIQEVTTQHDNAK